MSRYRHVQIDRGTRTSPVMVYQKQLDFIQSKVFATGFVGGRGTGKTKVGCIYILFNSRDQDEVVAVSPTYGVIDDTTLPNFLDTARHCGRLIRYKQSPTPRAWFKTSDNGQAEIAFKSGEDPEKLRGPSKSMLWLDEASVMHEDVFNLGIPILRHKGKMGKMLMTFTPKGRAHWTFKKLFRLFNAETMKRDGLELAQYGQSLYFPEKNTRLIHAHSSENPFVAEEFVDIIGNVYSAAMREQELGGKFVDIAGLLFSRDNFPIIPASSSPRAALRVRYWDRACTPTSHAKYTAGCLIAMPLDRKPHPWIIEHVVRGQWGPAERDDKIRECAEMDREKYGGEVIIYIEQEGGSGGKEIASLDIMNLAGHPVYVDRVGSGNYRKRDGVYLPGEAKVVRALALSAQSERQNVAVVSAPWNEDFLDELGSFPESTYSDQVDAASGAFNKLTSQGSMLEVPEIERASYTEGLGSKILQMQVRMARNGNRAF